MTGGSSLDWAGLYEDTRKYLGMSEGEPVPVVELRLQAEALGYFGGDLPEGHPKKDHKRKQFAGELRRQTELVRTSDGVKSAESNSATTPPAAGSDEPTPRPDGENPTVEERAQEAFRVAIGYFHEQLDRTIRPHTDDGDYPNRPTTAREYFTDVRGWDDETLAANQLGYAPAGSGLLDRMIQEGFDRETLIATGLFNDRLDPLWKGRYVLPYFDGDGEPVYAIARTTGTKGGGAAGYDGHPRDHLAGKYAKVRHTDDRVPFEEPIWGEHTLEDGEPVIVAEGIADAITAHERGYSVLSPVAKEFKQKHFGPLLDALAAHDVPAVYVIADNDPVGFGEVSEYDGNANRIRDAVTIPPTAPGIGGALRTASYLEDHDVTVRVAIPPAQLGTKADLDEYLQNWAETPAALIRSARPPEAFAGYEAATRQTRDRAATGNADWDDNENGDDDAGSGYRSALWELDLGDLLNASQGDRGKNPLGHVGDSENYFVIREGESGDLVARDYKRDVVYNALTYLLVDASERSVTSPEGRLTDRDVWFAWKQARDRGDLKAGDAVPYRALLHIVRARDLCDEHRIPDSTDDSLPAAAYNAALEYVEETVGDPGREPVEPGSRNHPDEVDPTTLDLTLDVEVAWRAARTVTPDDLDENAERVLSLPVNGGEGWMCPVTGDVVDIVRAVALEEGLIEQGDERLVDGVYDEAYRIARSRYGAPLPQYVSQATATDNWNVIQGAVSQLTHYHLSEVESEVTGDGSGDPDVVAELDPCWEESNSGRRIVAFHSGAFYCREHERVLDPLRFVALEEGLINHCDDSLTGEDFRQAYHVAREQRGAPLPEWTVGDPDHIPVLPPADDLLGEFTTDTSALDEARSDVEELYRELADDRSQANLLTALPALGKTTSVVKNATDHPALYLGARHELMDEVAAKAEDYGLSWMHLPIFAEDGVDEMAVHDAVRIVREEGKDILQDRDELVERIDVDLEDDEDTDDSEVHVEGDDDDIELDRGSCPTANGEHGDAWALAVHAARALGHSPQELHTHAKPLFGEDLPCQDDGHDCPYSLAWEAVTDPKAPKDLLIGHYGHGHVAGARTYYERENDRTELEPRVVAIDEFPGGAFEEQFGEAFLDHSTWLARSLHADVEDRQDIFEQDLWNDDAVRGWLTGTVTDDIPAFEQAAARLDALHDALEVLHAAERFLETRTETVADLGLTDALEAVTRLHPTWDVDAVSAARERLQTAIDDARQNSNANTAIVDDVEEDVLTGLTDLLFPFQTIDDQQLLAETPPACLEGDLASMFDQAVNAFEANRDGAAELVQATLTAVEGGEDGCRELAIHARDGYAHPKAYLLLYGTIADDDAATELTTDAFRFDLDSDNGTNVKQVRLGRNTVLVDRNHHGALIHEPPEFTARNGQRNSVIGLDATGREHLWELAVGQTVERRDIHETPRERREFLQETLNLQVVQTTPHTKTYEGSTKGKNFDGDIALVRAVAEDYGAGRLRRDTLTSTSKPGVITTKVVRQEIEGEIEDDISAIDHYGNVTGSNAMGELNLGVVLGCQHFGDYTVEKWAALAGEQVSRTGRGEALDYGCQTGNTYLKHMRQDQTLQAILRFGRDEEGAIVFAHTAALHDDLPVVGDGAVVRAFSESTQEVARAAQQFRDQEFTVSDLVDTVDCSRRTVRRVLAELSEMGYLERHDAGEGLANEYHTIDEPGVGDVELPTTDAPGPQPGGDDQPGQDTLEQYYTWFVRVPSPQDEDRSQHGVGTATLPAPDEITTGPPPG
mgnify:CR=1 FL=1